MTPIQLIDKPLLSGLHDKAQESERLRQNFDLRTTPADGSQRMLNALEVGTKVPIHRHLKSSETVICIRGAVEEVFFDDAGVETEHFELRYGSDCCAIQVPRGVYHTCRCLESGSVIFEAKDRAYDPVGTEDMLEK